MAPSLSQRTRLSIVIGISCAFFIAEISVGFYTHSLALVADAFHYLNDLVGFIIALVAIIVSESEKSPKEFSFGWQRAKLLGAFFNSVFLAALGLSIFLQSIERFISVQRVDEPKLVLIIGAIGLGLNIISVLFLHDHGHDHGHGSHDDDHDHDGHAPDSLHLQNHPSIAKDAGLHVSHMHVKKPVKKPGRDLGMFGVLLHVIGDAINNIGVMVSAGAIWGAKSDNRYYADPAISMAIAFMIFGTSIPLMKHSGKILLQSAPSGVYVEEVKQDLEQLPGVIGIHELHVWSLDQTKTIASAHILVEDDSVDRFSKQAQNIGECLHAYGIHSFTLQPELRSRANSSEAADYSSTGDASDQASCRIRCRAGHCVQPQCCD